VAYLHNNVSNFLFFRSVLRLLPKEYLAKLKTFYIVQAGILVRFF
jgi:hypothetical protein